MGRRDLGDGKKKRDDDGSRRGAAPPAERDVGHALRSVYSSTVNEDVPADLLDLLGKLD